MIIFMIANDNITTSTRENITSIVYDAFTQMTSQITSPSSDVKFGYNSINERLVKSDLSTGSSILYLRGMNDFPLYEKQNAEGDGSFDKIYIYGLTGLIAVKRMEGTYFVLKDHLGSTRIIFDGVTGDPVSYYDFTPYGSTMRVGGEIGLKYQFTGQEFDEEFALHNFRARFYDSDLAMFYGIDPAGQTNSSYGYAGNNPVIYVDKDGRFFFTLLGIASISYSIFQGFIQDGELGAFKNAIISGVGLFMGQFGGGDMLQNVLFGTASGGVTGGVSDILWGGDGSSILEGMAFGATFALGHSLYEYSRNWIEGFGFGSNVDIADVWEKRLAIGNTNEGGYQELIDFVDSRWGLQGDFEYDPKLDAYGQSVGLNKNKIGIFGFSDGQLRPTMAHEEGHSIFHKDYRNRLKDIKKYFNVKGVTKSELGRALKDGKFGYLHSIKSSGFMQVNRDMLFAQVFGHYINPYLRGFDSIIANYYLIPRRYRLF